MGLPIWRNPDSDEQKQKNATKHDPTAALRSTIRRRPSVHGRRTILRLPPRFTRSPPPSLPLAANAIVLHAEGRPRLVESQSNRASRRSNHRGVPPVSTLIESADRRAIPPPPRARPGDSTDSLDATIDALDNRENELRSDIRQLQERASRLEARAAGMHAGLRASLSRDDGNGETRSASLRRQRSASPTGPHARRQRMRLLHEERHASPRRAVDTQGQRADNTADHRASLPTPSSDTSEDSGRPQHQSEGLPPTRDRFNAYTSWRRGSHINGLGDRNRSPTPADGWETIQTTITPDATLPSADSSFTSVAASHSFAPSDSTGITEPDGVVHGDVSNRPTDDEQDEVVSSIDPDDLVCDEGEMDATAAFAEDMYYHEMSDLAGRERIIHHQREVVQQGRQFALGAEPERIEIGFRLIDSALESTEGRERVHQVHQLSQNRTPDDDFENWLFEARRRQRRTRSPHITDDMPPSPHPERYSEATRAAAERASSQVQSYFRRVQADSLIQRSTSPPPRYEPPGSNQDTSNYSSRDEHERYPPSPPTARSEREILDTMLSGDEQDLTAMRRIVERLAARDDVPDEWWMGLGLNLSRTQVRPRSRSHRRRSSHEDSEVSHEPTRRIRTSRDDRASPRL